MGFPQVDNRALTEEEKRRLLEMVAAAAGDPKQVAPVVQQGSQPDTTAAPAAPAVPAPTVEATGSQAPGVPEQLNVTAAPIGRQGPAVPVAPTQMPVTVPEPAQAAAQVAVPRVPPVRDRSVAGFFNDPANQHLLMQLGAAIGGEGSVGAAIGEAGGTFLNSRQEREYFSRLMAGESVAALEADPAFGGMSPEARARALSAFNEERELTQQDRTISQQDVQLDIMEAELDLREEVARMENEIAQGRLSVEQADQMLRERIYKFNISKAEADRLLDRYAIDLDAQLKRESFRSEERQAAISAEGQVRAAGARNDLDERALNASMFNAIPGQVAGEFLAELVAANNPVALRMQTSGQAPDPTAIRAALTPEQLERWDRRHAELEAAFRSNSPLFPQVGGTPAPVTPASNWRFSGNQLTFAGRAPTTRQEAEAFLQSPEAGAAAVGSEIQIGSFRFRRTERGFTPVVQNTRPRRTAGR